MKSFSLKYRQRIKFTVVFFIEIGSTKRNAVKHTKVTKKSERKLPGNQQKGVLIALF